MWPLVSYCWAEEILSASLAPFLAPCFTAGEDPVLGVGPDSVLVQHGEETVPAEEARDHEDHVSADGNAPKNGKHLFVGTSLKS